MALRFLSLAAGSRIIVCTHSKICRRANEPSTGTHKNQSKFSKSTCDIETISKDSSQPACCFSFWDYPKDLQGYLDPKGAAKHGRMPRERWQRLISQSGRCVLWNRDVWRVPPINFRYCRWQLSRYPLLFSFVNLFTLDLIDIIIYHMLSLDLYSRI